MMKKITNKYRRGYRSYVAMFRAEKKIGNIKEGVRQLTYKQYFQIREIEKKSTANKVNTEILFGDNTSELRKARQAILTPKNKIKFWKDYLETRVGLKPGQINIIDNSFFGDTIDGIEEEGNKYHRTLSGLMHDKYQLHFIISDRILSGEDRDLVLEDYGY